MNKLPALTGWAWLKQGAGLFRKQPGALMTLLFANILFSIAISAVPILGPLVAMVLIPVFSVAFMRACLMIDNGKRVTPAVLLSGFHKPVFGQLAKIGLIYVGVAVIMALVAGMLIDAETLTQVAKQPANSKEVQALAPDVFAVLSGIFLLELAMLITLSFAAPLVFWQQMKPGKATFYSFFAVVKSARVFVVLLLAWFAILFGTWFIAVMLLGQASIVRIVIMWMFFLLMLVLQCALYVGYRQIFGKPDDPEACPA
ncbi:BPSS1780 family membrane protein [Massilia horti]|uniref:Transmembrane protein n=1 Tax=Massilia horti TaxID=2562153 RepID=A0A4Y9TA83_9BURK|nr:BPSS1780 family membrane protein [Massilia horti]TFW35565.1 hypothetical protein E4O92_01880 [Massilia horti]